MKVELSISCSGLADLDTFSKSDPVVYLYQRGGGGGGGGLGQGQQRQGALGLGRGGRGVEWVRIGRTEVVMDNLNPQVISLHKLSIDQFTYLYSLCPIPQCGPP